MGILWIRYLWFINFISKQQHYSLQKNRTHASAFSQLIVLNHSMYSVYICTCACIVQWIHPQLIWRSATYRVYIIRFTWDWLDRVWLSFGLAWLGLAWLGSHILLFLRQLNGINNFGLRKKRSGAYSMGKIRKTVTKHEHCCMRYANRKPNYQMAQSDLCMCSQRHCIIKCKSAQTHAHTRARTSKKEAKNRNCFKPIPIFNGQEKNCIIKTNWTFYAQAQTYIGLQLRKKNSLKFVSKLYMYCVSLLWSFVICLPQNSPFCSLLFGGGRTI